jgi:AcrR family transcriptional regulator
MVVSASGISPIEMTPKPVMEAEAVGDPILDAAANCVARNGFDNTSLEEVATEAGVSRTTLYRRFGSREALFAALLRARSEPFRKWSRSVLAGHGSVAERLETVIVHATLEMQSVGWLDVSLRSGISRLGARLLKTNLAQGADEGMGPLIDTLLASRPDCQDISRSEVLEWVVEQMIGFAGAPRWERQALHRRVRFFVIPVIAAGIADRSVTGSLAAIEAKLDRLLEDR